MSRSQSNNPFEDILQPQPRHARPTFQDDPFEHLDRVDNLRTMEVVMATL
jgi:hypothetical protein